MVPLHKGCRGVGVTTGCLILPLDFVMELTTGCMVPPIVTDHFKKEGLNRVFFTLN
jgi:hypothetical protein